MLDEVPVLPSEIMPLSDLFRERHQAAVDHAGVIAPVLQSLADQITKDGRDYYILDDFVVRERAYELWRTENPHYPAEFHYIRKDKDNCLVLERLCPPVSFGWQDDSERMWYLEKLLGLLKQDWLTRLYEHPNRHTTDSA